MLAHRFSGIKGYDLNKMASEAGLYINFCKTKEKSINNQAENNSVLDGKITEGIVRFTFVFGKDYFQGRRRR